jgi:hypothetical protein
MTIAEWRVTVEGYTASTKQRRRDQAWAVSHLLIAAGCDADKVTPAQLLGEKISKRQRIGLDPEVRKARERAKVLERIRKDREKRGVVESEPEAVRVE